MTKFPAGVGRCEESNLHFPALPCNKPATTMIAWPERGEGPYRMCSECANHSIKNRGARSAGTYDGPPPEAMGDEPEKTETGEIENALQPSEKTLAEVFANEERFEWLFNNVQIQTMFEPNLTTKSGRAKVASVAHDIAKLAVRIDKTRLATTKELRDEVERRNKIGKKYEEKLRALQTSFRAPLTAWEQAEDARVERVEKFFATMTQIESGLLVDSRPALEQWAQTIRARPIDPDLFCEREPEARVRSADVLAKLDARIVAMIEEEARAEAARIEQEAKDRELEELRQRVAAIDAEKKAEEERKAEAARAEQEAKDRAEREAEEKRLAEERARLQAENARLAQEKAELERQQEEARQAEALKRRKEAEAAQRQRDDDHRAAITAEIAASLIECVIGLNERTALLIATQIAVGSVRHVTAQF